MIDHNQSHPSPGGRGIRRLAGLVLLPVVFLMYLAWPGNHMWGDLDQPLYINMALQANQDGRLSSGWRQGNAGFDYHPFPVWVYQFFLSLTHDLAKIRLCKALISLVACLGGLLYLSRSLGYPSWVVHLYGFSPFCYLYNFELTDDSWLVPTSLLVFVCYAGFFKKQTWPMFMGLLFFLVVSVFLHPRGAILFLPVMMTLLLFDRHRLKNTRAGVLLIFLSVAVICIPYLLHGFETGSGSQDPAAVSLSARAALFLTAAFSGGLFFSYDLFQLVIPFDHVSPWIKVTSKLLIGLTMIGYLLVVVGIIITVISLVRRRRYDEPWTLEDRLGGLTLSAVFVFSAVVAVFGLFTNVEYYTAIWFCYFFFIWRTIKTFGKKMALNVPIKIYVLALAASWISLWSVIHFEGVGLTLSNAVDAARQLCRFSPQSRIIQNTHFTYGDPVENINHNLENAFGNVWYYREMAEAVNESQFLQDCLKGKYIYTSLVPLLHICYADRDVDDLPVKTILLEYKPGKKDDGLIVNICPDSVVSE